VEHQLATIAAGDLGAELSIGRQFVDWIAPRAEGKAFGQSVFINCPFDDKYRPLFQVAAFTVTRCRFIPRCAQETDDSSEPRLSKILRIIGECKLGIHDLSRIEPDHGYPRFNMPFELGLFLGAKHFGRGAQDNKSYLVFEGRPHTYERFISDIKGIDIACHKNSARLLVQGIRDWLSSAGSRRALPGGPTIFRDYQRFQRWLPTRCRQQALTVSTLTWRTRVDLAAEWVRALNRWCGVAAQKPRRYDELFKEESDMAKYTRNTGKTWTKTEVAQLKTLARENTPTRVIGLKLGRTEYAIRAKASNESISLKPTNQSPYGSR
jgi:hypothetical protein